MIPRILAVTSKEFKQLWRDKSFLFVLFFFPIFLLAVFGYAINLDVHHIRLGVLDKEKSEESRDLYGYLSHSEYFDIVGSIRSDAEVKSVLDNKLAQAVMVIPQDFSKNLHRTGAKVQFLIDGVDGNTATIIYNYVNIAAASYNAKIQTEASLASKPFQPLDLRPIFLYNPELKSSKYLIPGLMAMILAITAVMSVSLSLVKEKELGSIEQINVSSLKGFEVLTGKSIPYVAFSFMIAGIILLAGYFMFDVVVKGSFPLLMLALLIYVIASVNMGIFVSTVAETQQVAFSMATFLSMLPSMLLSGFIFPIESMPPIIQIVTNLTPAKFFLVAIRGIILKGVGVSELYDQFVYLTAFASAFGLLAVVIAKRKERMAS